MSKARTRSLPEARSTRRRRRARAASGRSWRAAALRRSPRCSRRRPSPGAVLSSSSPAFAQAVAHRGDELEEPGLLRVSAFRGWGRSTSTIAAIRPGRVDMTTTRVERKTASAIECVTKITVEPVSRPDPEQLHVQALPRHLVERAERLVHEQERGRERERAGDRHALLHPARELPRVVLSNPSSSTRLEHLVPDALAPLLDPSRAARAAARCSSRRCASRRAPASWKTIP